MKHYCYSFLILACLSLTCHAQNDSQIRVDKIFTDFKIKGAGGSTWLELSKTSGANTIRTWAVYNDGRTKKILDDAHSQGLKVELGFWMAGQGDNGGWTWDYENEEQRIKYIDDLNGFLNDFGNHPAILVWELGNEVNGTNPDQRYIQFVNDLSLIIHEHNPDRLTSLVTNANSSQSVQKFKTYAPDLDMIGINGYGTGMSQMIVQYEQYWDKSYYISEYNASGYWGNRTKTSWGDYIDQSPSEKVTEIKIIHDKIKNFTTDKYKGATAFLWEVYKQNNNIWHSMILSDDFEKQSPSSGMTEALLTPMADEVIYHWNGSYLSNQSPIIEQFYINDETKGELIITSGDEFKIEVLASDPNEDQISYKWSIYGYTGNGNIQRERLVSGPFNSGAESFINLTAPDINQFTKFNIHCLAMDNNGGASAHTFPLMVTPILSAKSQINNSKVYIYPNPIAQDRIINFSNLSQEPHQLSLFNINGEIILSSTLTRTNQIDLRDSKIVKGLYFYQITNLQSSIISFGKLVIY